MAIVTRDTYQTFLDQVLAKIPEDRRESVQGVFRDETVAAQLRDAVLARSDYSRTRDEVDREIAEARSTIKEWQDWYAQEVEQSAVRTEQLTQYKELYGDLDETDRTPKARKDDEMAKPVIDQDALNQTLAQRDQMAMQFADLLTDLKIDHRDRFGERLDTSSLMEYANKHQVSLKEAYRELVAPKEQAKAEADLAQKIAAAREEGRQAVLSEHKLPVGPPRREPHYMDIGKDAPRDQRTRVGNAVAAFNAGIAGR